MKNRTIPYLFARFFDGISSGMFMMALPWSMLLEEGMGFFVAITALVCTSLSFVFTPFFATLIDRHSRKTILILMQLIQATTALIVFITYYNDLQSHWVLAFAQLIFWLSNDLAWSCNNAFTQENYRQDEYAKISSYQEVVMQVTTLGAGALGIVLLEHWSMLEFSFLATFASFLSGLCYIVTPYQRQFSPSLKEAFFRQLVASKDIFSKQKRFYTFLALSCLSYPVLTFLVKLVPIYFAEQDISGSWFATWKMSYGLGALLSGLLIARLLTRYDHENAMVVSILAMAIILILMGSYLSPTLIILLTIVLGFFNSYNRIARTNKMHHVIVMEERGRVEGGLKLFSTLAQSLSYVVIALLSHLQLTALGFIIIGIVLLIAGMMMLYLKQSLNIETPLNQDGIIGH
ncbi:MFS transporter [Moritella sp. Urea-trap-13]|uniref:MFS transporter n=1 Tax=Moritella sp. Urea-trap-13 TaxID=2058327 RepID=UPI000C339813|nr:MFS transporter [Moritella sp. Urea-trap-13]PKH08143.1 MFS transporter [Moritella sp. Urea-trap-13]